MTKERHDTLLPFIYDLDLIVVLSMTIKKIQQFNCFHTTKQTWNWMKTAWKEGSQSAVRVWVIAFIPAQTSQAKPEFVEKEKNTRALLISTDQYFVQMKSVVFCIIISFSTQTLCQPEWKKERFVRIKSLFSFENLFLLLSVKAAGV